MELRCRRVGAVRRIIRCVAFQPKRRPLSVVSSIASSILQRGERSDVPNAAINLKVMTLRPLCLLDLFDFRIAYYLAPFLAFGLDKIRKLHR